MISHNVPFIINGVPIRKVDDLLGKNPTLLLQNKSMIGVSSCYGDKITRVVDFSLLSEGKLFITDCIDAESDKIMAVNFYSPEGFKNSGDFSFFVLSDANVLKIRPHFPVRAKIKSVYLSEHFSKFTGSFALVFEAKDHDLKKVTTELDMDYERQVLFEMSYRGFGPILFLEGCDWYFDNDYPANVCHHIMSLRWLNEIQSVNGKKRIMFSFINYHNYTKKKHSKFYLGKTADHTTSIRLCVMLNLAKEVVDDQDFHSMLLKELESNIISCLNETYKYNNNHGLMVDKAILICLIENEKLRHEFRDRIDFIFNRIKLQFDGIFDKEGYCREHSISYQEYNLGIAFELLEIIKNAHGLEFDSHADRFVQIFEDIKLASRKSLGFVLKDNLHYFAVGDSFSTPKKDILKKVFGSGDPMVALQPYSQKHGVFSNITLGIAVYRSQKIHLVLNCSWHSYVHKQNDDLNVFLRLNGEDFLIDGGYSDIISLNHVNTRSESLHSTFFPLGKSWISNNNFESGYSRINDPKYSDSGLIVFSGCHTRIIGSYLERKVIIDEISNLIKICDSSSVDEAHIHRFIFPSFYIIDSVGQGFFNIHSDINKIRVIANAFLSSETNCWSFCEIDIVVDNKVCKCKVADYKSNGTVVFDFLFS